MKEFSEYMANLELADMVKKGNLKEGSNFRAKGKHAHRIKRKFSLIDWILSFLP